MTFEIILNTINLQTQLSPSVRGVQRHKINENIFQVTKTYEMRKTLIPTFQSKFSKVLFML